MTAHNACWGIDLPLRPVARLAMFWMGDGNAPDPDPDALAAFLRCDIWAAIGVLDELAGPRDELRRRITAEHDGIKPSPRPASRCSVYVFACPTLGRIKIGYTGRDAERRRGEIQASIGHQLETLRVYAGDRRMEGELHLRFAGLRIMGTEWFEDDGRIRQWVGAP